MQSNEFISILKNMFFLLQNSIKKKKEINISFIKKILCFITALHSDYVNFPYFSLKYNAFDPVDTENCDCKKYLSPSWNQILDYLMTFLVLSNQQTRTLKAIIPNNF